MAAEARTIQKRACVSACGAYRYRLERRWSIGPRLLFVMLNPSIADSSTDDPTIRRCQHFALAHGFAALEVVNLFAWRATRPADMWRVHDPVGLYNDSHILDAARAAAAVCVAWGAQPRADERIQEVMPLLQSAFDGPIQCLQITRSGYPSHPLMLRNDCVLKPFTLDAIQEAMANAG